MRFELRISGGEHVSREWVTGNRIIALHSRETQEGPGTGNCTHSDLLQQEWSRVTETQDRDDVEDKHVYNFE